jgi:hypothetical protein
MPASRVLVQHLLEAGLIEYISMASTNVVGFSVRGDLVSPTPICGELRKPE